MRIGCMWFDNSKRSLPEKLQSAVQYYETKYGRKPTLAYVHPKDYQECNFIQVQSSKSILRNHFWLGIGEQEKEDG